MKKVFLFTLLLSAAVLVGCAVNWIDKVEQTRVASAKTGYRVVSEYNRYYFDKTNFLGGTTPSLENTTSNIYHYSVSLGRSLQELKRLEDAYRLAPTNQAEISKLLSAVASQSSNLVYLVNTFKSSSK